MKYNIQFKPRAVKDIERLSSRMQLQIIKGIEAMSDDLKGDVKRLTNFTPEYRFGWVITGFYLSLKIKTLSSIGFVIAEKHIGERSFYGSKCANY